MRIAVAGPEPLQRDCVSGVAPGGQFVIDPLSQLGGFQGGGLRVIDLPGLDLG